MDLTHVLCKATQLKATVLPDGRWLLYDEAAQAATTLTAPAGIFWELCDGQTPVGELVTQLREMYPNTPVEQLEMDTLNTARDFLEQGLVTNCTA